MKKITSAISAIAFIFAVAACTPENNNKGDNQKFSDMIDLNRCYGFSVRPVSE